MRGKLAVGFLVFATMFLVTTGFRAVDACAHAIIDAVAVHLDEQGVDPAQIEVTTGQKIVFENSGFTDVWPASDDHPTHTNYSDFDPRRPILPGETWSYTFAEPGTYAFHDHLQPDFVGVIIVTGEKVELSEECQEESASIDISNIKTDFVPPVEPQVDPAGVIDLIKANCPNGEHACVEEELAQVVDRHGPDHGLSLYTTLTAEEFTRIEADGHQLAHRIGRRTAQTYGVSYEAFDLCSTEYNYGCQHGYFEYVLGRTNTSKQAIEMICTSIDDTKPRKSEFYCYHGAGHGVMMAQANDLDAALDDCDALDTGLSREGCWQGVFMENINAYIQNESREGVFDEEDYLAPCNSVDDEHKYQCYHHQGSRLVDQAGFGAVKQAAAYCLEASGWEVPCLQSIGIMTTDPSRQGGLLGGEGTGDFLQDANRICEQFPAEFMWVCTDATISNISNFDQLDTTRAFRFCGLVSQEQKDICYRAIGRGVQSNATGDETVREACTLAPEQWRLDCLDVLDGEGQR